MICFQHERRYSRYVEKYEDTTVQNCNRLDGYCLMQTQLQKNYYYFYNRVALIEKIIKINEKTDYKEDLI